MPNPDELFDPSDVFFLSLSDEDLTEHLKQLVESHPREPNKGIPKYLQTDLEGDPLGRIDRLVQQIRCRLFWLYSENPEVVKVREWFSKHPGEGIEVPWYQPDGKDTPWDVRYWMFLSLCFQLHRPLSAWETASAGVRNKHVDRVANLAKQLAEALTEEVAPGYPGVLAYLSDRGALRLVETMKADVIRQMVAGTQYEFDEQEGSVQATDRKPWLRVQDHLDGTFPMSLPGLLARLAADAEMQRNPKVREKRPNMGNPDVRVFTRTVAGLFKAFYNRQPDEVIAAIVSLAQLDPDYVPNAELVRSWRGSR